MGTDIGDILKKKSIELNTLSHKIIAIDAYNTLYQFLSIIRQNDGTPLKDSKGNITSHMSGILYRMSKLVEHGIKPVFIFDGKPPQLKEDTIKKRNLKREEAKTKWIEAKEKGLPEAYLHAQASSKITTQIIADSQKLLEAMGIPWIQAPSEAEAQAAYMVKSGKADYVASQDYDSFLFGAPVVIRNLTLTGKRKLPKKNVYVDVKPELINLQESLLELDISYQQLVDIGICVGTDFNPGLTKIGSKRALKLIKEHENIENLLSEINQDIDKLEQIKQFFLYPPVSTNCEIYWNKPDVNKIIKLLCEEHDFSKERVLKACEKLNFSSHTQKTLDTWF